MPGLLTHNLDIDRYHGSGHSDILRIEWYSWGSGHLHTGTALVSAKNYSLRRILITYTEPAVDRGSLGGLRRLGGLIPLRSTATTGHRKESDVVEDWLKISKEIPSREERYQKEDKIDIFVGYALGTVD